MVRGSRKTSRRRVWLGLLGALVAVGLVVGTWLVAASFQSPAQRQAAADPPVAQPVLVEVTRGDLADRTTVMATAARSGTRTVLIPTSAGDSVVTGGGVSVNSALSSGSVVVWVNDRPIFALRGDFPLYRDVGEGDSGKDVKMIQQALADLGYGINPDGDFGAYTGKCIKDLYDRVGATVPTRDAPVVAATPVPVTETPSATDPATPATPAPAPKKQVVVQRSAFMVVTDLPGQVSSVPGVGTTLTGDTAKLVLSSENITLSAEVPGNIAVKLTTDLTGTVTTESGVIPIRIESITEPNTDDPDMAGNANSVVAFIPLEGTFPAEWAGRKDLLIALDLTASQTGVLIIPQRAIATDSGGKTNVLLEKTTGTFEQVTITQTGCVGGMCAIKDTPNITEGSKLRVDR